MRLTDGEGVELVQDFIGAPYLERNLSILKTRGRMVMVGLMGGADAELNLESNHAEAVTGLRIGDASTVDRGEDWDYAAFC